MRLDESRGEETRRGEERRQERRGEDTREERREEKIVLFFRVYKRGEKIRDDPLFSLSNKIIYI